MDIVKNYLDKEDKIEFDSVVVYLELNDFKLVNIQSYLDYPRKGGNIYKYVYRGKEIDIVIEYIFEYTKLEHILYLEYGKNDNDWFRRRTFLNIKNLKDFLVEII